ncbi:ribonuclease P protein component [Flavihumibacter stibioxidans]|uniref:Ribonuclease P protein component n=1 Tax=Flavihumibacter stibioxidans TaxID=1834163 RepID=A0ABR7M9F1_9BACT|nr:ribonuclease P protein component [Flavihumibacter stibioxidans]MBC6491154.1 ribonuclease P protein component [Flavihumibacter stibioxidans]
MSRFTLHGQERLKHRKKIDELFKTGRSFAIYPVRVYYGELKREGLTGERKGVKGEVQFGVGVSKRYFKKAVDRNRIKRLIRESYRLQKEGLYEYARSSGSHLSVFFIYTGKELPGQEECLRVVEQALAKLVRLLNPKK